MPATTDPSPPAAEAATWDDALLRDPHAVSDKRRRVQQMFAAIAPSYDLNNRLHSLWMDQRWRRKAVKHSMLQPKDVVIDVACGTADLTMAFVHEFDRICRDISRRADWQGRNLPVVAIDFTYEMLPIA